MKWEKGRKGKGEVEKSKQKEKKEGGKGVRKTKKDGKGSGVNPLIASPLSLITVSDSPLCYRRNHTTAAFVSVGLGIGCDLSMRIVSDTIFFLFLGTSLFLKILFVGCISESTVEITIAGILINNLINKAQFSYLVLGLRETARESPIAFTCCNCECIP